MTNEIRIAIAAVLVTVLGSVAGGVWYASAQDSKVTTIAERQENIVVSQEEAVEERAEMRDNTIVLQKYHIALNAKEEGEEKGRREAIQDLCDDGRLTGNICDEE